MIATRKKSEHRPAVSASASASSSSDHSLFDSLTSYILLDILSRLPIRAVMVARCVCKTWFSLTSDSDFAKLHWNRAPTELLVRPLRVEGVTTDLVLGDPCSRHTSGSKFHFNYVFQLPRFTVSSNNDVCFKDKTMALRFVGSCHGLLCYSAYNIEQCFAVIWNPIMGQFVTVPPPEFTSSPHCWIQSFCYGFGFSPVAKRFKLLRMFQVCDWQRVTENTVEVLTLEEGAFSWRNVGVCPYLVTENMVGVFVESVFHWVVNADKNSTDTYLYSFDFDSEQFGEVLLPPQFVRNGKSKSVRFDLRVGELGGSLALLDYTDICCVDVWVMKEYGVRDSWVKVFSIEEEVVDVVRRSTFELIKYMDNGEVLMMKCRRFLVSCDQATKSIRTLGHGRVCDLEPIAYKPSLFPLQDVITGYHVHAVDLSLRPIGLAIRGYEASDDSSDWWDYWLVDGELFTKFLKEKCLSTPDVDKLLSLAMFIPTHFTDDCEGEICLPAKRELEGCLSPDTMKRNVIDSLKDELMKEECSEENEFAQGFLHKQSRIDHLQELIERIEKMK